MKTTKLLTGTFAIAVALFVSGCQSTQKTSASTSTDGDASAVTSTAGSAPTRTTSRSASYDTSVLVTAFRTSDITSNQMVSSTVNAINSRNYSAAANELRRLLKYPGLTAPQETAVKDLLGRLSS